jgi:hypothetical protein
MARRIRQTDLSWRVVDGEVIILDLRSSAYLILNRGGSYLWSLLNDGETQPQRLADALVVRYNITSEQAVSDVAAFIERCQARGLLEIEE